MSNTQEVYINSPETRLSAVALVTSAEDGSLVTIGKARKPTRSSRQNALSHRWYSDASMQGDQTQDEYAAMCKLHFGVPILRRDDAYFREMYDKVIKRLPYHLKLRCMGVEFGLPVTSRMTVEQMTEYLINVHLHFTNLGIRLTDPALQGMSDWREWQ